MSTQKYKSLRNMTDEEVLERIKGDYESWQAEKEKDNKRCRRYEAIYKTLDNPELRINQTTGKIDDDVSRYSHNYLGIGAAIADAVSAQLFNSVFAVNDYMEMAATNWEDMLAADRVTPHMLNRHREMKFKSKVYLALLQATCYDYCVTGYRWMLEPGFVQRRKKEVTYKQIGKVKLPFQRVYIANEWVPDAIDRPDMFVLNYFHCYHDPTSENGFEDSRGFIDVRWEMIETLINQAKTNDQPWGKYINVDKIIKKVKETEPGGGSIADNSSKKNADDNLDDSIGSRRVKIIRYWTRDHVAQSCLDFVIHRQNISGYPLERWGIYPIANEFKMMGALQRIERNQYDINSSLNAYRNWQNLVSDPIKVINEDLVASQRGEVRITSGETLVAPSGQMPKDMIATVSPAVNIAPDAMQNIQLQIDATERLTVSENTMGTYASGRRSATEAIKVDAGEKTKTSRVAEWIEDNCLIPFYQGQFLLEQTFLTKTETFKYFGKYADRVMVINPADYAFASTPIFYARGTSEKLNAPVRMQQFLAAMDRAMMAPQFHKMENIFTELWKRFCPRDYHNFVKDPRETDVNIPPDKENLFMAMGHRAEVSPLNDHGQHIQSHESVKRTPDYALWPEAMKLNLENHIAEHKQAMSSMAQQSAPLGVGNAGGRTNGTSDANMMRGLRPQSLGVTP